MDAAGAEELRKRLDDQQHWRRAAAVRDGRQSATDPDAAELDSVDGDIRYYGRETQRMLLEGRPALVTFRIVKTIVAGRWETSYEQESTQYLDGAMTATRTHIRPDEGI